MTEFSKQTKFPFEGHRDRISRYDHYYDLLEGNHFEAFAAKGREEFTKEYQHLRYIVANFAGLVAKVSADMLFGEDITIRGDDKNQDWLEALYRANKMKSQLWESAATNAALGDGVFKMRAAGGELIIEDLDPRTYFPYLNSANGREEPRAAEIAWVEDYGNQKYLIRELHTPGEVATQIHTLTESGEIEAGFDIESFNEKSGREGDDVLKSLVKTNIERLLVFHVPNARYRKIHYGFSDFRDIEKLIYAVNNRMSKVDEVLDKHTDPILAVPEGVLDEEGNIRKEAFAMIEMGPDGEGEPKYVVWNAELKAAFEEIDRLVDFMYMFSETSQDVFGKGTSGGKAESGRALRFRLLRTISKTRRKQKYYHNTIQDILFWAQDFAKANNLTVEGEKFSSKPQIPEIVWADGIVNDPVEDSTVIAARMESGTISRKTAIMRQDGLSETEAEEEIKRIEAEDTSPAVIQGAENGK